MKWLIFINEGLLDSIKVLAVKLSFIALLLLTTDSVLDVEAVEITAQCIW